MSKKFLKLMSLALVVMMMSLALVACGNDDANEPQVMTEEEYKAKVEEISTKMQDMQTSINEKMATIDPTDTEAIGAVFEEIKAPFIEFASLNAPEKYAEAQAKFKSGCEAMIQFLDLAKEMTELQQNPESVDQATLEEKATQFTDLLTKAMTDITEGATLAEQADAE